MELILDAGNTRVKAGLFHEGRLVRAIALVPDDLEGLRGFIGDADVLEVVVGSVASAEGAVLAGAGEFAPVHSITGASASPVRSSYRTPSTLGVDRLANAVAAAAFFPGRAALAIDLGTCITYDLVDPRGNYLGGAISPGMRMRAKAMHAYSARLPLVEPAMGSAPFGDSTESALQSGLYHGISGELERYMHMARSSFADACVVLTGGDALAFARGLKSGIFAHPFLTLEGLRLIHRHLHAGTGHTGAGLGAGAAG